MKIIAMIPARLGSQRVKQKNLRLINGKPLIAYVVEAAKLAKCFDEIYINSEAEIFCDLANSLGVSFYKRSPNLASNEANNDDFAIDFIKNTSADILIQLLPTSPLITADEINSFVAHMVKNNLDTLISVVDHQIAGIFNKKAINFSNLEPHISSQNMQPVKTYATVLMGWKYETFKDHMNRYGFAYHGADGVTDYYPISGLSTIDIDNEEDFQLAEIALQYKLLQSKRNFPAPRYWGSREIASGVMENDVPSILKRDGVVDQNFGNENQLITNIRDLINSKDSTKSWSHRIINTENNSATLISQMPGEGNRLHYHDDWNEWWYIVSGSWQWEVCGSIYTVSAGDLVFIEKNKPHKITAIGPNPAIRLAVSRSDVSHIYPE